VTQILLFFHVLCAAAWLGAALWVPRDAKRTLALGKPFQAALPARVAPALELDLWSGVGTVATGLVVLSALGGRPRLGILIGFALALARLALTFGLLRPSWRLVASRISAGEEVKPDDPAVRRMSGIAGAGHALWAGALFTMVLGF